MLVLVVLMLVLVVVLLVLVVVIIIGAELAAVMWPLLPFFLVAHVHYYHYCSTSAALTRRGRRPTRTYHSQGKKHSLF